MMNEVLPNKTKIRCDQNSVENELGCIIKYHLKKKEKKIKSFFFKKYKCHDSCLIDKT